MDLHFLKRFAMELRRREVFRSIGLYVGICWILIEVGNVLLPTFDTPEWVFQAVIMVAIAGFPIMLVFAWVYDISEKGIEEQADPTDTFVFQLEARKTDFVVIGVLALALFVSLYFNVTNESQPIAIPEPVPVLVADFKNLAEDLLIEDLFEEALIVGIECAPHITAYDRTKATRIGSQINAGDDTLSLELAHRVAQREGIELVLAGSLEQSGTGYRLTLDGVNAVDGRTIFTIEETATSKDTVFRAIGNISLRTRKMLGDTTLRDRQVPHAQTFSAATLEAARAYMMAKQSVRNENPETAADYFERAIALDPSFGRVYSGLALVEFKLGRTYEAEVQWKKALSLKSTMTEREHLRDLGLYYASVVRNNGRAVEIYSELVDKYPADVAGRSGYATAAFLGLDFDTAIEHTRKILEIYPANQLSRIDLALYAMYYGDWETAANEAARVIADDAEFGIAYLPLAIAALAQGQADTARDTYRTMGATNRSWHGASLAELGLADIDLYVGRIDAAQARLRTGIDGDIENGKHRAAALKYVALAQSLADQGDTIAATEATVKALELEDGDALAVPAAMIYIQAGDLESAKAIADNLAGKAQSHSRAYGQMLRGMMLASEGVGIQAVIALREAIGTADLWLIRYHLGREYLQSGHYTQGLDELMATKERYGEATAVFLDHTPTFRYLAELPYWMGRAQEALNMRPAARASYKEYVAIRPEQGRLAQDAMVRAAKLE